jgi:hypothetical protein
LRAVSNFRKNISFYVSVEAPRSNGTSHIKRQHDSLYVKKINDQFIVNTAIEQYEGALILKMHGIYVDKTDI